MKDTDYFWRGIERPEKRLRKCEICRTPTQHDICPHCKDEEKDDSFCDAENIDYRYYEELKCHLDIKKII